MPETTTKPPPLAPLPLRAPVVDRATGLLTAPWVQWLGISRQRQGGANAPSNDELATDLTGLEAELAALQAELDATQAELAALQAQLASDLPPGTALSLPRYQADGVGLESTPGLQTTPDGKLGVGVPVPVEQLEVAGALHLGAASATPADGTLHWDGTDFYGRKSGAWLSLTVGEAPPASETVVGVTRYGTSQETVDGVLTTVATHPAGLKAALEANNAAQNTGSWRWTTATSGAVNNGQAGANVASRPLMTELRIAHTTDGNVDAANVLAGITTGDTISLQDKTDASQWGKYEIAASGANQGTWTAFPVTHLASAAGSFTNNQVLLLKFEHVPPVTRATETEAGVIEIATTAEVLAGTDATRAVTPAGLAAKVPTGTPLAMPRYAAAADALETAPGVFTSANAGQLQLCDTATPPTYGATNPLTIDRDGATQFLMTAGLATGGVSAGMTLRSAPGPVSAPTATQLGTRLGYLAYGGHDGSAYRSSAIIRADGTEAWTGAASGTVIRFQTMANGGTTLADRLRIDGDGNLNTTGSEMATGLRTGLALGLSVAPTTDKANTVQLWIADLGGLAGKASLHLRSEDSGLAVFGTQTGLGTHCAATLGSGEVYRRLNVLNAQLFVGVSSVQERPQALLAPTWVVSTDSSRAARLALSCHDATAAREFLRGEADGSSPRIGFLGAGAVVRQTLPAAATDATTTQALANALRTALITFGLGG